MNYSTLGLDYREFPTASFHFQINFVEDMETRDTLQLSSRKSDEIDSPPAVPSAAVQHAVLCLCSN